MLHSAERRVSCGPSWWLLCSELTFLLNLLSSSLWVRQHSGTDHLRHSEYGMDMLTDSDEVCHDSFEMVYDELLRENASRSWVRTPAGVLQCSNLFSLSGLWSLPVCSPFFKEESFLYHITWFNGNTLHRFIEISMFRKWISWLLSLLIRPLP